MIYYIIGLIVLLAINLYVLHLNIVKNHLCFLLLNDKKGQSNITILFSTDVNDNSVLFKKNEDDIVGCSKDMLYDIINKNLLHKCEKMVNMK